MSITIPDSRHPKRRKTSHEPKETIQRPEDNTHVHTETVSGRRVADSSSQRPSGNLAKSLSSVRTGKISMLAGTATLSSTVAAQAAELVENATHDYRAKLRSLRPTLDHITRLIKEIPDRSPVSFSQAEKSLRKQGVAIPFGEHRPLSDIKYAFGFSHIEKTHTRGLLALGLAVKTCKDVEIAVEMPASVFHEKDFLNHRAFHKRAYYVACIAAGLLQTLKDQYTLQYDLYNGNSLLPILRLSSKETDGPFGSYHIIINVLLADEIGPAAKMQPDKNCVRPFGNDKSSLTDHLLPTPFYNSTFRANANALDLDRLVSKALQDCQAFRDACILGQIWLQQRGFSSLIAKGGFGAVEWINLTALLLTSGGQRGHPLFSIKYTSMQLFKAVLQVLSSRDLVDDPLVVGGTLPELSKGESPMLFDFAHGVNVLSGMSLWSYAKLKHLAQLSLTAVNSRKQNNFDATFVFQSSDTLLQFDEAYDIEIADQNLQAKGDGSTFLNQLYAVLKRGLGDRATLVDLQFTESIKWSLTSPTPSKAARVIRVGLLVDSAAAARTLDHGPTAEEREEAQAFRAFWGEKSELRRFRDGRITETLVWSEKFAVTSQVIEYLSILHFKILPSSITNNKLGLMRKFLVGNVSVSPVEAFKVINTKYQELASKLYQLEGLPLPIRSVSPACSSLRSAAIGHPLALDTSVPLDMLIQFDSTTRWPDHLPAIQYTKIAFLTKLADLLSEADPSCITRIGTENTENSSVGLLNTSFLDVIQPAPAPGLSSIVFRLRIHHDRELHLLRVQQSLKTNSSSARESVAPALTAFKREFIASPVHTAAIRNLITHFNPLSDTMRLLKYWIASHHLTNHVPEPVIEILAAHVFLHPYPWSTPGTAETGFLRCLHFLSHWDWSSTPLVVDLTLTQEMPPSAYTEFETRFQAWRKLDPVMSNISWLIGTSADTTGTVWTQGARPPRVIGTRISALAKASVSHLRVQDTPQGIVQWDDLFESGVQEFDFAIHLKSSVVKVSRNEKQKVSTSKYRNLIVQEEMDVDQIGHDVVQLYLRDLESTFGSSILFFYGYGGKVITGLWKPSTTGMKEWRVRLGYSSLPVNNYTPDSEEQIICEINKDSILAEIAELGEGMVEKLEVHR